MESIPDKPRKWFEDFEEGISFEYSIPGLTATEIVEFAQQYDPQRFHLNKEEAVNTHFGGLVASGFQTQLLCFRPFCEEVLQNTKAVGAPGIDSLKWLRPWFPGESLEVEVRVVSKRLSSKRNDRGYLGLHLNAEVNGAPTLAMEWVVIMLTKEGAKEIEMTPTKIFPNPRATITELVDACHAGDGERLRGVFSQGALMTGYFNGEYYSGSPEPFYDEVRDNPAPASIGEEYIAKITSVEEYGDIASAILEENNFLGANFINLYQLVRIDGNWLIVSKTYVDEW